MVQDVCLWCEQRSATRGREGSWAGWRQRTQSGPCSAPGLAPGSISSLELCAACLCEFLPCLSRLPGLVWRAGGCSAERSGAGWWPCCALAVLAGCCACCGRNGITARTRPRPRPSRSPGRGAPAALTRPLVPWSPAGPSPRLPPLFNSIQRTSGRPIPRREARRPGPEQGAGQERAGLYARACSSASSCIWLRDARRQKLGRWPLV